MADPSPGLPAGLMGHYRIEREVGEGGMATVYLAHDLKHHRRVAIKVLKPALAAALGADRFLREITTTASLRHPHILPLYDSGDETGVLYYVMPFVEGESLRDRLDREKQLPVHDAVQIAAEVADALNYAHGRGVVHRDIKPENILLESGHAVVADFGIAQAIDLAGGGRLTDTGIAIGTPTYMSPEQAAGGKDLDGRSDLYALACVVYEMLAGQPPFTGPTAESVLHQHLVAPPPPVTQLRPAVSADIAGALQRALTKTPADRFPAVAQFADALTRGAPGVERGGRSAGRVVWPRRALVAGGVALLAALGVVGILVLRRPLKPLRLGHRTQVTLDPGLEIDPSLSADGKLVAYSDSRGALVVREVAGGAPVQVLRAGDDKGRWPVWLPDGQRIVFVSPRGIEVVPALGGVPRLLIAGTHLDRGIAVAPDGQTLAFVSHDTLYAEPLAGGRARAVTTGWELHSPVWSRDGRWIAYVTGNLQYTIVSMDYGNIAHSNIWVVPAGGGAPVRVSDQQSLNVSPAWTSGRSLIFVSNRDGGRDLYQVFLTPTGVPQAAPVRLTTGLSPSSVSLSQDGSRVAYSTFTETSNVWSLPIPAVGTASISAAKPETEGNQMIENLAVSLDGRWLGFTSDRSGSTQVYRLRLGGSGAVPQQITSDTADSYWVGLSPDAKEVAFHRFRSERRQVFTSSVEGGAPAQVTDGADDERSPEWSPDGRRLLVLVNWASKPRLHILTRNAEGRWSAPRVLPVVLGGDTIPAGLAIWSPDGRFVACGCGEGGIAIVPVDGGPARRLASSPFSTAGWAFPQWSADGRTVFFVMQDSDRVVGVVASPVFGGSSRMIVRFNDPTRPWHRFGFRVAAGRFFFTLGDREGDIWVSDVGRD